MLGKINIKYVRNTAVATVWNCTIGTKAQNEIAV